MKTIKIIDNALGPVLKVEQTYLHEDGGLVLLVNPGTTKVLPSDNINDTVSNAFIYIVQKFIKNNNIDFKPNGDFDSQIVSPLVGAKLFGFKIHGTPIDPMEHFIEQLNESK